MKGKSPMVARTALVQGAGMLGLYACALLKETGYHTVYCSDMNEDRLKLSSLFGAMPVRTGSSELEHILNEGVTDVVLEACGVSSVVSDGVRALCPGGMYILVGLVHPDSKLDITAEQIIRKCLTIKGIHNYANQHLEYAVEFISQTINKYPYDKLVSPPYPLRQLSTAIDAAFSQEYLRISVTP
jgi:threonine dehydrogenase-like Zn-dependent dehydrogenase